MDQVITPERATQRRRTKQPTKAELQQRLDEANARAEAAEATALQAQADAREATQRARAAEAREAAREEADHAGQAAETDALAQLRQQLEDERRAHIETARKAEALEAAALAKPRTATPPPGGPRAEALQPDKQGVLRIWAMTADEGYRIRFEGMNAEGTTWAFIKWSDGTVYHAHEPAEPFFPEGNNIECDCPGGAAHGPQCNGGKGCKHARVIHALRKLVDPGL
jgi:hypothetical protein